MTRMTLNLPKNHIYENVNRKYKNPNRRSLYGFLYHFVVIYVIPLNYNLSSH
jgi:hypothetical protein